MTPEQITQGLYDWLLKASRIDDLPFGARPCSWDELVALDPVIAGRWREGTRLLLETIGARPDEDEHLNFVGTRTATPPPALDGEPGEEPPPVRPDD